MGRRKIDLAEETLTLFYEARDVIDGSRSAIGWESEYREAAKKQREASEPESGPLEILIVTDRLYRRNDLFAKIRALRYRFAAVFGRGAEQAFRDLVRIRTDVVIAERHLPELRRELSRASDTQREKQLQRIMELSNVVEGGGDENDPTTIRLSRVIQRIEQICCPVIQGNSRGWGRNVGKRFRQSVASMKAKPWFARLLRIWTPNPPRRPTSADRNDSTTP